MTPSAGQPKPTHSSLPLRHARAARDARAITWVAARVAGATGLSWGWAVGVGRTRALAWPLPTLQELDSVAPGNPVLVKQ